MQNTVSETIEVSVTISVSFQYFDFIVTAFGEAVGNVDVKRVCYSGKPVAHSTVTLFKRLKTAVFSKISVEHIRSSVHGY